MNRALLIALYAGCSSPGNPPAIDHVRAPWGPLAGGTVIEISGMGFDPVANRVLIGGKESPFVRTIDDATIEAVVPPGDRVGASEMVVLTQSTNIVAADLFRYSAPPLIAQVAPQRVLMTEASTTVSLIGTGFADEDAGPPVLLVDGQLVDVSVRSDTLLTFQAPTGGALSRPLIELVNARGRSEILGYRYMPSAHRGVVTLSASNENSFAHFYDPVAQLTTEIPRTTTQRPCFYSAMLDASGDVFGSEYCSQQGYAFGRIDFDEQTVAEPVLTSLYYAMVQHRGVNYGVELQSRAFGTFEADGTNFQPHAALEPNGQFALASDQTTMWILSRDAMFDTIIRTITPQGLMGTPVTLSQRIDIADMIWLDGTIYGVATNRTLVTIDPVSGLVTTVANVDLAYAITAI